MMEIRLKWIIFFVPSISDIALFNCNNAPDIVRRTGNLCLTGLNIGPSSARFGIEIAKMSYFHIVEQHIGIFN